MKSYLNKQDEVTRRTFMSWAASSFLGVSLAPMMSPLNAFGSTALATGKAERVIYLYLSGGMSHLDTFDPKPGTDEQGPTQVIDTNVAGIRVSQHLPELAKQMDKISIIRSMKSTQGEHERGNYFMHTGYLKRGTIVHPSFGAWSSNLKGRLNPAMPAHVLIGGGSSHPGAGFFDAVHSPVPIGDPKSGLQNSKPLAGVDDAHMQRRLDLMEKFDREFHKEYDHKEVRAYSDLYTEALKLMKSEDLEAFDISKESEEVQARYLPPAGFEEDSDIRGGKGTSFGLGCLLARRLVERDVRFVEVDLGGWDTHTDNFERVPQLATLLDRGVSALIADLSSRGLLDSTLVVVATEFGRSPKINETDGRNHHPQAFSTILAGGGIKGGQVIGKTDKYGNDVEEDEVSVPDFTASIAHAQGMSLEKILYSPSGRPFTVADKGKPVMKLFA